MDPHNLSTAVARPAEYNAAAGIILAVAYVYNALTTAYGTRPFLIPAIEAGAAIGFKWIKWIEAAYVWMSGHGEFFKCLLLTSFYSYCILNVIAWIGLGFTAYDLYKRYQRTRTHHSTQIAPFMHPWEMDELPGLLRLRDILPPSPPTPTDEDFDDLESWWNNIERPSTPDMLSLREALGLHLHGNNTTSTSDTASDNDESEETTSSSRNNSGDSTGTLVDAWWMDKSLNSITASPSSSSTSSSSTDNDVYVPLKRTKAQVFDRSNDVEEVGTTLIPLINVPTYRSNDEDALYIMTTKHKQRIQSQREYALQIVIGK